MDTANLFSVKGRVALVTGGSAGIGRMIATGLAAAGARVYICARNAEKVTAAAAAMESALVRLRDHGDGEPAEVTLFDFRTFSELIGFQEVWDFERAWAR